MGIGPPKYVFFRSALRPGGTLQLVESQDGRLSVVHDGVPLPECNWDIEEMDAAICSYRRIVKCMDVETCAST